MVIYQRDLPFRNEVRIIKICDLVPSYGDPIEIIEPGNESEEDDAEKANRSSIESFQMFHVRTSMVIFHYCYKLSSLKDGHHFSNLKGFHFPAMSHQCGF